MTVIENADQFLAVAARNGVEVGRLHAAVALKYFEAGEERLVQGDNYKLWLEPKNDPGNGYEYNVAELFEVALECAEEIYNDACAKEHPDEDLLLWLCEDQYILKIAVEEARKVIPVEIKTYAVNIIEYMRKTVYVEAASSNEAEETVKKNHAEGLYGELSPSLHRVSTMINVIGPQPR